MSNSEIITEIPEEEKQAFGKILKAYMDYKARGWAKNKLNGQKVLKKYQNIQQTTTVLPQSVKGIDYTSSAKTLKPSSGGLFTDRERIKDVILQEMKQDQIKAENEAKEEIKNKLLAYNDRKRFLQELKLQEEIPTKQDEKKIVRDVFTQAFLGLRDKLKAKQILRTKKLIKKMENEKPLSSISTSQDQLRLKNIYASVVEDATNSALARLVELDGKQYVAQHLAIESPKVVLKKSTLAQKLGLEERNIPSINLFSSPNNRNEADIMSSRALLNKKIDKLYKENLAKRLFGAYKTKTQGRYSAMQNSYNALTAKPGRLVKGSQEAKDYMASIRAMRKPKTAPIVQPVVAAAAPKRRGRPPKLPVFGPPNRRGRPSKYTP